MKGNKSSDVPTKQLVASLRFLARAKQYEAIGSILRIAADRMERLEKLDRQAMKQKGYQNHD